MLKTRLITAAIALPLFFLVFLKGDATFMRLLFMLLVGVSSYELSVMLFPAILKRFDTNHGSSNPAWLIPLIVGLATAIYAVTVYSPSQGLIFIILGILAGLLLGVFLAPSVELSIGMASGIVICLIYGAFPWIAIWELFRFGDDSRYLFLLCSIIWAGDSGAYFAGRAFGKHKLAPSMSPNKTWEGAVGGIVASLIGGACVKFVYGSDMVNWAVLLPCCILGGILGQLGDLTESTFKRFAGMKDSGKIFPGHGGFLDRVDGLLFAAPVIWFILYQFGG